MKTVLTSLSRLYASHAIRQRVDTVASNLRRLNAGWKDDWYFPAEVVGLSNDSADVNWVRGSDDVHLNDGTVTIGGVVITTQALDAATTASSASSRSGCEAALSKFNSDVSTLVGRAWGWGEGILEGGTATASETTTTSVEPASVEDMTADAAYEALSKLGAEDILAVVMRVNTAKGALLKNANPEEQQLFIKALTGEEETASTTA